MLVSRRSLLKSAALGAVAGGVLLKAPAVLAQAAPLKLKFGNDLPATHTVKRLKGLIPSPKKAVSLEDMDRAIASGAKGD